MVKLGHFQRILLTHALFALTLVTKMEVWSTNKKRCRHRSYITCTGYFTKYYDHAFLASVYIMKKLPTSALQNQVSFVRLFNTAPDYNFLKFLGVLYFSRLLFRSKGYKCLPSNCLFSKIFLFIEFCLPFPPSVFILYQFWPLSFLVTSYSSIHFGAYQDSSST